MPFLFWMPIILLRSLYEVAENDTRRVMSAMHATSGQKPVQRQRQNETTT